jgi:hypothetical protein
MDRLIGSGTTGTASKPPSPPIQGRENRRRMKKSNGISLRFRGAVTRTETEPSLQPKRTFVRSCGGCAENPCFGTRFLRANCESHRGTVQAEPAPQPATTRIVHSSEIADDPGGFEGDYVPLEDHRAALALQRETRVPHPPDLIEALAAYAHEAWAGWMRHLFKRCWLREGTATIPSEWRERWERQTLMPYAELPDGEKESDRKEARRMLAIVAAARQETPAVPPAPCLCTPGVRTSLCPIHGYEGMDRAASPSSVSAPSVKEGGE